MRKLVSLIAFISLLSACSTSTPSTPTRSSTPNSTPAIGTPTSTPLGNHSLMQPGLGEGVHILSNYKVRFPVYGVQIIAMAQNNTDRLVSTPEYVTADFMDAGGKKIGSAFGLLNSIPPRSVKIFLMAGTDSVPNYSKVNFNIGQIIDGDPDIEKITIGEPSVSSNIGGTHIRVPIENLSQGYKTVALIAGFFDSKGKIIGVATGGRRDLGPGKHDISLDSEEIVSEYSWIEVQLDSLL